MKNWKPVRIERDIFIFFLLLNKNFKKENWGRRELKRRWDCEVGPKGRWGKREREMERKLQHQDSEGIVKDS